MTTLDQNYKKGLTEEQGISLAVKAVQAGKKRDIYSGGESVTVMIVNKNGIRELEDSEVQKHLQKKADA